MKTTLELPEDLLMEAKTVAVRRKTTLRALIVSALRREIRPEADLENPDTERYAIGPFGSLVIKKQPGTEPVTPEMIRAIQDEMDEEDLHKAYAPTRP